jgi:hypothetical protein
LYGPSLLWPALSCAASLASLGINHILQHKVKHLHKQEAAQRMEFLEESINPHHQQSSCCSGFFTPQ